MGFPKHIIRLIKQLYIQQESCIRVNTGNTERFKNGKGVRQGCILSPYLFNLYTEAIMREEIKEEDGVTIQGKKVSNLRYADDTALLSKNKDNLQDMVNRVASASNRHGLYLNAKKTKIMIVGNDPNAKIQLNTDKLETVKNYKYLGANITDDGLCSPDIKARFAMAKTCMMKLDKIWKDKSITTALKTKLIKSLIWPIGTYGCESWTISKKTEDMIQAFEMWTYRKMLQVTYREHKTNEWVLSTAGQRRELLNIIRKQKLKYYAHVKRSKGLENTIMEGAVAGNRKRGRPRTQWIDNIKEWMGMSAQDAGNMAKNRDVYRQAVVNALKVYDT